MPIPPFVVAVYSFVHSANIYMCQAPYSRMSSDFMLGSEMRRGAPTWCEGAWAARLCVLRAVRGHGPPRSLVLETKRRSAQACDRARHVTPSSVPCQRVSAWLSPLLGFFDVDKL